MKVSIHPHKLVKFKENFVNNDEVKATTKETSTKQHSVGDTPWKKSFGTESYYDEEEDLWFCNGGEQNGLKEGCKSGQKDFGRHPGIEGFQC